ncbi:hypothetical protein V8E55_003451, partial [Tylopilus felleus]
MSAALQSALTILQRDDYVTVAMLTAVGYDYILTFSNEIKYIWRKPWSSISVLFLIVRYGGLYAAASISILGSSFLPGPIKTCGIIFTIEVWTLCLFLAAADFSMILRVWVMYGRSRLILGALLTIFCMEIILFFLCAAIYSNPKFMLVTVQILNISICVPQDSWTIWAKLAVVFQITHGAIVCVLAVVQSVRQALQMYRATKQWQLDRYMNMLVTQGLLYFFAMFLFSLLTIFFVTDATPAEGWETLQFVPIFTLTPRFIIKVRELYARDIQGRRCEGIDTGFGWPSLDCDTGGTVTTVEFAEAGDEEEVDGVRTTRTQP